MIKAAVIRKIRKSLPRNWDGSVIRVKFIRYFHPFHCLMGDTKRRIYSLDDQEVFVE